MYKPASFFLASSIFFNAITAAPASGTSPTISLPSVASADPAEESLWIAETPVDVHEYTNCNEEQQAVLAEEWEFARTVAEAHLEWNPWKHPGLHQDAQTMYLGPDSNKSDPGWAKDALPEPIFKNMQGALNLHYGIGRYKPKGFLSSQVLVYCEDPKNIKETAREFCHSDDKSFVPAYTQNRLGFTWNRYDITFCADFFALESSKSIHDKIKNKVYDARNISPWEYSKGFIYHHQTYTLNWLVSYPNQYNTIITAEQVYNVAKGEFPLRSAQYLYQQARAYVFAAYAMYAMQKLGAKTPPLPQESFKVSIKNPTGSLTPVPTKTASYWSASLVAAASAASDGSDPNASSPPKSGKWTQVILTAPGKPRTDNPPATATAKGATHPMTTFKSTITPKCQSTTSALAPPIDGLEPIAPIEAPYCICGAAASEQYFPPAQHTQCDQPCGVIKCTTTVTSTPVGIL